MPVVVFVEPVAGSGEPAVEPAGLHGEPLVEPVELHVGLLVETVARVACVPPRVIRVCIRLFFNSARVAAFLMVASDDKDESEKRLQG